MIWRLRGRSEFAHLRQGARRYRSPAMTITFAPDVMAIPPRVGFSVGRAVGGAVVRNRLRRRLRTAVRTCDRRRPLAPGRYLITGRPPAVEASYSCLERELCRALDQVVAPR